MSTIWKGWRKFWPIRAMEVGAYADDVGIRVSQCCLRKARLHFLELPAAFFLSGNESTFIAQCWSLCIYLVVHCRNLRKVNLFYYIPLYWDVLWFGKPAITSKLLNPGKCCTCLFSPCWITMRYMWKYSYQSQNLCLCFWPEHPFYLLGLLTWLVHPLMVCIWQFLLVICQHQIGHIQKHHHQDLVQVSINIIICI